MIFTRKALLLVLVVFSAYVVIECIAAKQHAHIDRTCSVSNNNFTELNTCYKVFQAFETALRENKFDGYILRKSFFYSPLATPVLLQANYNITFNLKWENFMPCPGVQKDESIPKYATQTVLYSFAWSATGIYTAIHPALLNAMQFQLPFGVLKLLQLANQKIDPGPHLQTFLWDSYNAPSLVFPNITLQLMINNSLPCAPSYTQLHAVLQEITSLLKVYAGFAFEGDESHNSHDYVGYGLKSTATSLNHVIKYRYSKYSYILHFIIVALAYILLIVAVISFLWHKKDAYASAQEFIKSHEELYKPGIVVSIVLISLAAIADLIMLILWAAHLQESRDRWVITCLLIIHELPVVVNAATICACTAHHTESKLTRCRSLLGKVDCIKLKCVKALSLLFSALQVLVLLAMFFFGYSLVYILAIARTGVISFGPLVVVSLLPSVGMSFLSWIIRKKVFAKSKSKTKAELTDCELQLSSRINYNYINVEALRDDEVCNKWNSMALFVLLTAFTMLLQYAVPTFVMLLVYPLDITVTLTYTTALFFTLVITLATLNVFCQERNEQLHIPSIQDAENI